MNGNTKKSPPAKSRDEKPTSHKMPNARDEEMSGDASFDHSQIDDLIHSRLRLAIMAVLMSVEEAEFTYLRSKTNATDGNLSVHLRKLEEAGYIAVNKIFRDRKPITFYKRTDKGSKAFRNYVKQLEGFLGGQS